MKRFRSILLVCDIRSINKTAVARAITLAKANDAQLTLIDVIETAPGELGKLFRAVRGVQEHDVEYEVQEFHRAHVGRIAETINEAGVATSEVVVQGIPFVEVISKVLRDGHDLVIKGAAGEWEAGSLFFAGTDLHLLRKCPCPVWLMRRDDRHHYARILAAVDPDPEDEQRDALNTTIMELATSLSRIDQSELHVIHVWNLDGEDMLRHSGFARVAPDEVDLLVEEKRRRSAAQLDQLLLGFPDTDGRRQVHLSKGLARKVVPEFAERKRVELIVMGTVARTGIQGLIIGNTAETILNQVACSVLAVKPPGFVSPVQLDTTTTAYGAYANTAS